MIKEREAVLVGFGLATAQVERIVAGGQTVGVARVRITEAGRQEIARNR